MFSEIEIKRIKKAMQDFLANRRPAPELRNKIDINYRLDNNSIVIYSMRPKINDPLNIIESSIAKTTYIKKENVWKIYWQRADLEWHPYEPKPVVQQINDFIEIIDKDEYGCFWG